MTSRAEKSLMAVRKQLEDRRAALADKIFTLNAEIERIDKALMALELSGQ